MWFDFKKLNEDVVLEAIESVKKGDPTDDYIGSVYVGQLEIALFLKSGLGNSCLIKYEINVGGIDTEYGYTIEGEKPYDFGGSSVLINSMNVSLFEPYEKFKKQTIDHVTAFIKKSDYNYNGITLLDKANDKTPFNWD